MHGFGRTWLVVSSGALALTISCGRIDMTEVSGIDSGTSASGGVSAAGGAIPFNSGTSPSGGTKAMGSNSAAGGSVSSGGAPSTRDTNTSTSGATASGGVTATTSAGAKSTVSATAYGGTVGTGGTMITGGGTWASGGSSPIATTSAYGGTTAIGGTRASGGTNATGGTTTAAGSQAFSGGAPASADGGPCNYRDTSGTATITSIHDPPAYLYNCPNDPVMVEFDFVPTNSWQSDLSAQDVAVTVGSGANPNRAYILGKGFAEGKELPCIRQDATTGSCTPTVYYFPEILLYDYAPSCFGTGPCTVPCDGG